ERGVCVRTEYRGHSAPPKDERCSAKALQGSLWGQITCLRRAQARAAWRGTTGQRLLQPRFPVTHLLVGFILGDAVVLLDAADQLVALAGDAIELVVGDLAPLLLGFALELAPIAFDAVPVHHSLLRCECDEPIGQSQCPAAVSSASAGSARSMLAAPARRGSSGSR